jgi:membrane protein DedA with SNARE-associated domain
MPRWAGWGAGPAGAGATGGPTRSFLAIALVGCAIVAGVLFSQGRLAAAGAAACAAIYFALRLFGGLGR